MQLEGIVLVDLDERQIEFTHPPKSSYSQLGLDFGDTGPIKAPELPVAPVAELKQALASELTSFDRYCLGKYFLISSYS